MSLIHDETDAGTPQLHALIVAVGHHAAPEEAADDSDEELPPLPPLPPLESPGAAARELARWLEGEFSHPEVSLGSVEMLVSDPGGRFAYRRRDGTEIKIERARGVSTARRFERWFERCDARDDNVALLFLCGHGVTKDGSSLVLLEEAGAGGERLEAGVDFSLTSRWGMAACRATRQLLVADTCRVLPPGAVAERRPPAPVLGRKPGEPPTARSVVRFDATVADPAPFRSRHRPPPFTDILLRCLRGGAARRRDGRWEVGTDGLVAAVQRLAVRHNRRQSIPLAPGVDWQGPDALLHEPRDTPQVLVDLRCEPVEVLAHAQLRATRRGEPVPIVPEVTPVGWRLTVPADVYGLTASTAGGSAEDATIHVWAEPPLTEGVIRCR